MQTKLLIATLAALADTGRAAIKNSDDTDVTRQVHREQTLEFIRNMANCDVAIDQLEFNYAPRESGDQDNYLQFTLKDAENCPPMRVEAWIETPGDSLPDARQAEKKDWTSSEVDAIINKRGPTTTFKTTRNTSQGGGDMVAHVRIWDADHDDDGGEWTMPLVSHCTTIALPIRCPEFSNLQDKIKITSKNPEDVAHSVNFGVDDASYLELCRIEAVVSVYNEDDAPSLWVQDHLDVDELKAFLTISNAVVSLNHHNELGSKKCAQVEFINIDTKEALPQLGPICQDDMTPMCTVDSITVVDSCTADKNNNSLTVKSHTEITNFNEVCRMQYGETIPMTVNAYGLDGSASDESTADAGVGLRQKTTSVISVTEWPDNEPIWVQASTTFGSSTSDSELFTCPTVCSFENVSITISDGLHYFESENGRLFNEVEFELIGTYNEWCGSFYGKVEVTHITFDEETGARTDASHELLIPISEEDMEAFYLNDLSNPKTITGTVQLPYVTGDHEFKFKMERLFNEEFQTTTTDYKEIGEPCIIEVNLNVTKVETTCAPATKKSPKKCVDKLVETNRYDPVKDEVILEAQYQFWAQTQQRTPINPKFCNLDVLELGYYSRNFNTFLQNDSTPAEDINVILPKTVNLPEGADAYQNNMMKVDLLVNGFNHKVTLPKQDVDWYGALWYDYECDDPSKCLDYFYTEPALKTSPKTPYNWRWFMSCKPEIYSLKFGFSDNDDSASETAKTYFTYELGGSLVSCGCNKDPNNIGNNLMVTYDLIRDGTGFTDIDFAPVTLTKGQLLAGIRDKNNKNWQAPQMAVEFERQDGEYKIQMTFSELVNPKTCDIKKPVANTKNSDYIKIMNKCDVFINSFDFIGSFCSDTAEEIDHKFQISYATSKYCKFTTAQVELVETQQRFQLPMSGQNNFKFEIKQSEKLDTQNDYTAVVSLTSEKVYSAPASKQETRTGPMNQANCDCSVHTHKSHDLTLLSETHTSFSAEQSLEWDLGAYCYGKTLTLQMGFEDQAPKQFPVSTGGSQKIIWHQLDAVTDTYKSDVQFYSDDGTPITHSSAKLDWIQSCWVDITSADIKAIRYENDEEKTGKYLDIALSTAISGECGTGDWDATLTILKKQDCNLDTACDMSDALEEKHSIDNDTVNSSIKETDFRIAIRVDDDVEECFSTKFHISAYGRDGARLDLPISIPEDTYNGLTLCSQKNMSCVPSVDKFDWASKPEEVDGTVTPKFDIELSVDKPHSRFCQQRSARVVLFDKDGNKVTSDNVPKGYQDLTQDQITLAMSSGLTFTWDDLLPQHEFYQAQILWNVNNGQDDALTSQEEVKPKCHLKIPHFDISDPRVLDQDAKAEFDVTWQFSHTPAQWCTEESAMLTLTDQATNDVLFAFNLSPNDITTALTSSGMKLTPRIDFVQGQTIEATIKFDDTNNAGEPVEKNASVKGPEVNDYCDIVVETFCLRGEEVRNGESMFIFDIKVDKSSACGPLSIGMDIIHNDKYADLPQIDVDPAAVEESNTCNCLVEIAVPTGDFILSGDFYGQIDIREAKSNLIIVQDSIHHTF